MAILMGATVKRSLRQCHELRYGKKPRRWEFIGSKLVYFGTGGVKAISVVVYDGVLNE
jgi:hypothetical protein